MSLLLDISFQHLDLAERSFFFLEVVPSRRSSCWGETCPKTGAAGT